MATFPAPADALGPPAKRLRPAGPLDVERDVQELGGAGEGPADGAVAAPAQSGSGSVEATAVAALGTEAPPASSAAATSARSLVAVIL